MLCSLLKGAGWRCHPCRLPLLGLLTITWCLSAVGCGADGRPLTVKVKGIVTYAGNKLTNGTIAFIPTDVSDGEFARPSSVELDAEGNYTLSTFSPGDGIPPGKYQVTIVSYERAPDPATPGQAVWAIPRKYGDAKLSGLTADIQAEDPQPVELDFDLVGEKDK